MRKTVLGVFGASALVLAVAVPGFAGPNCGLVKKDLAMGRTPEDISERMMVPVDEVKKCQTEGGAAAAPGAAAPAADPAKPAVGAASDKEDHEGHGH